ncbi:hypothetical protein [Macrococcus capreoli]|uniref:hypothetical protein n=1 Tax=Macrococcus capreoli TaxID=2982690 RepID=UPI0021D5FF74|nr:hypothetical protein [Macrococcus sp. TMW 2.2395]MCU7556526.1 hypothetical protein [Macrococcus sp. TMW 2.2395]
MERNFEKELGLTQSKLSEALAKEVMLTALIDDLSEEIDKLTQEINGLKAQASAQEAAVVEV